MTASRRVVITGIGAITPLGLDAATHFQGLLEGRSGIRPITAFDASALPVRFAGDVEKFDAKQFVEKEARKGLRMMARTIQLGVAAAQRALDDGRVDKSKLDPTRFGVEFGAGLIASELPDLGDASRISVNGKAGYVNMEVWGSQGLEAIQPLWMLKYLPNMPACHISILHNAQGPNNSITESDAASLLALGEAYRTLVRDGADFFLVGGAESKINPVSMVRQVLFGQLSRCKDPRSACRPFDRDRDGIVVGEGSTVFTVEEAGHAQARGARIYAEVVGFGAAFDRRLDGTGLARAVRAALADAGIGPDEVDHVNAHGLGSPRADLWEARGLHEVFGSTAEPVPVYAGKGAIGNLGAAGGLTELAASVLALHGGTLPASRNHRAADPECPVRVAVEPRAVRKPFAVKVGFTEMGQCGAVVIRRWEASPVA
jgi:3-oxoacyl-[acyl-carrier-protein] synthase II